MRIRPLVLLLAAGCAHIAPPPGGPEDKGPPMLLATHPDSFAAYPDWNEDVEFRFDEVVSEGGSPNIGLGTGDLEKLVVLSPGEEVPVVRWRRNRITVRPREGWRPNTVYRIELLPGVRDLRNNISRGTAVVTFTTGGPLPTDTLRGRVVDWSTARPAPGATVLAVLLPDSLAYRTVTDSTGRFTLGPLPGGEYLVYGVLDANRNGRLDPREHFDTARAVPARRDVGELWAFRHDSTRLRAQAATADDSVTVAVTFSAQLDPYQRLPADSARLLALPDSTPLPVLAVLPRTAYDSVYRARRDTTRADTTRADTVATRRPAPPGARRDTVDTGPLTTRPALFDRLLLRLGQPVTPGGRYLVQVHGVRSVSGIASDVQIPLVLPAAPAAPAPGDTAAAPPDTGAGRPDTASTRPDPAAVRLLRSDPVRRR